MEKIKSFEPIIDANSKILILGSSPGNQSIQLQQYYGNPKNQFWEIIFRLYNLPIELEYNKRIQFLKNNNIALWDVISTCKREGSLDSSIKEEEANNFNELFNNYPNIKLVVFNGKKAYNTFYKKVRFENIYQKYLIMPSTSPANAIKLIDKIEEWKKILE